MIHAGVIGSTGYVGQQIVWFLNNHPDCQLEFITSHSYQNAEYSSIYGQYRGTIEKRCIGMQEIGDFLQDTQVVFIALPHGKSFDIARQCLDRGVKVIDIGADFRLNNAQTYKDWYKLEHLEKELLEKAVYGLPEIYRNKIKGAELVANPGCYPTASILGMMPLLKHNLIQRDSIIIDGKSGVSGAGRATKTDLLYGEVNESFKAYGVAGHRHIPEMEQELSKIYGEDLLLSFTPHLVPMNRGILITGYGLLKEGVTQEELYSIYRQEYGNEPFIRIMEEELPQTRWVKGTNFCDIGLRVDGRTNRVIVVSAIDNMVKGAAGQAIQNMNLLFDKKENLGLDVLAMLP